MKKFSLIGVILILVAACGGSPTGPTSTPSPTVVEVQAPAPPTPAPAAEPEPVPVPVPVPAPPKPAPPVPRGYVFTARVIQSHWFGPPVFHSRFEVSINSSRVKVGSHRFDILSAAPGFLHVIAGTRNVETLTINYHGPADGSGSWTWTYNGLPGQAYGSMVRR
jgi:hypothetical protein